MDATIIIAIVPVVLLVAYIVWLVRAKITEGREIDLREPITALVICLVAVLIIGSMTASTVTYTYSEDTNTLYINQNLIDRNQPFDSYGDEVKSVVIGNNCRLIETGTLDSLTNLEYVEIGENVEVRAGAFDVTFTDPFGQDVPYSDLSGFEYVGFGDGTLYQADPAVFAYTSNGKTITGLASGATGVTSVVIPRSSGTATVTEVGTAAFDANAVVERILTLPDHEVLLNNNAVRNCTALEEAHFGVETTLKAIFWGSAIESTNIPAKMTTLANNTFWNCASLASIEIPASIETIGQAAFRGCTSLTDVTLNEGLKTINSQAFYGCTSIQSFALPASVETIGGTAFRDCSGVTSVSFAPGFSAELADGWCPWTFFEADGTTQIDKSQAANLAGKSFQGVYNALVEVSPGQLSLTPQQLQQVQLHTQELQQQELDIQPTPFQPTVQTQDQEPVAA